MGREDRSVRDYVASELNVSSIPPNGVSKTNMQLYKLVLDYGLKAL